MAHDLTSTRTAVRRISTDSERKSRRRTSRLKEAPLLSTLHDRPLPTHQHPRAILNRILNMPLHLLHRRLMDQRPMRRALRKPIPDLERLDLLDEERRELVVDRRVDEVVLRAHARLTRSAEFGGDGSGDSEFEVGVGEDCEILC